MSEVFSEKEREKMIKDLQVEEGLTPEQAQFCVSMAEHKRPSRLESNTTLWSLP